jgi:hypothetical protein
VTAVTCRSCFRHFDGQSIEHHHRATILKPRDGRLCRIANLFRFASSTGAALKNVFLAFPDFIQLGALALGLSVQMHVFAGTEQNAPTSTLPSLPAGIAELNFMDFFVMPVGPRGLEMTQKLLGLDGRRVRIVGYMAQQEDPRPGFFMLAPVPVNVAETSDGMADDLPPATLVVHLPPSQANNVASHQSGLLVLTGTLSVGDREEGDGRISMVRLQLDAPSHDLASVAR